MKKINEEGTQTGRISCVRPNTTNHLIQSTSPGPSVAPHAVVWWPPIPKTLEDLNNQEIFKYAPIAVSFSDWKTYGCPHCGGVHELVSIFKMYQGTFACRCKQCGEKSFVLRDGLDKSTLGFGDPSVHDVVLYYPTRSEHPLK